MTTSKARRERRQQMRDGTYHPRLSFFASNNVVRREPKTDFRESETVLADDYPVYAGYAYLVDGHVILSDITGTVRNLFIDLQQQGREVSEIRRCNLAARGML